MTWLDQAACVGTPAHIWFPTRKAGSGAYAHARLICSRCPVTHECVADGIRYGDYYGMRGGLTPDERALVARRGRSASHTD